MARNIRQRWYSAQGQSQMHASALERSSGTRRLISLLILLGMVLVLIQQTSDVKKVEKVATAIGLLPNSSSMSLTHDSAPPLFVSPSGQSERNASLPFDESAIEEVALESAEPTVRIYHQVWASLFKRAPASVVDSIARKLFRRPQNTTNGVLPEIKWTGVQEWYDASSSQLAHWNEIEAANAKGASFPVLVSPISEFMNKFQKNAEWFSHSQSSESETAQDDFFRGLAIALDKRILGQVVDNSPWWSTDWLPFARGWQRIETFRELLANRITVPQHFPRLEGSQLLMGSQDHRGKPIRLEGTVYQVDSSSSIAEAGFANLTYKVFWLRPDDASRQPIKVYAPAENIDSQLKLNKDSRISLVGFFLKRIAYKSQRGQEFSPLFLAAHVSPFNAVDAVAPLNPFQNLLKGSGREKQWQPPVDIQSALSIVRPSLQQALLATDDKALVDGFQGANVAAAIKPILELERIAPEFDLLLQHGMQWPITESAAITQFAGIATRIERIRMDSNLATIREQPYLYRLQIESDGTSISLLCTTVPNEWLQPDGTALESIRQPCVVDGVALTQSDGSRLAWSRTIKWERSEPSKGVDASAFIPKLSESTMYLLDNGWNLAWKDLVRELQTDSIKPLSAREIEPFYRLMELAKRTPFVTTEPIAESDASDRSIVKLLDALTLKNKKTKPVLERVSMNMRIVRVSSVRVDNPEQAAMLGSDRYYQLDGMADIGNRAYEDLGDKNSSGPKEPILHHKEYPVTCVTVELPPWLMSGEQDPKSESSSNTDQVWYPRMKSTASGWFYRFWSYKTQETSQSLGENHRQIGPLVVLDSLSLGIRDNEDNRELNTTAKTANTLTLIIGVLGALGIWWFVRNAAGPKRRLRGLPGVRHIKSKGP